MNRGALALVGCLPFLSAMAPLPNTEALEAAAQKGARPAGCAGSASFWKAALATRSSDCAKLARGYSLLASDPGRALELAQSVKGGSPASAPAALLEARAAVGLRDFRKAWAAFERAGVKGPEDLFDVAALHAYARTAAQLGNAEGAAAAYRLLMPRLDALPTAFGVRLSAVVEAAFAAMSESSKGAAEASAFLTPALEQNEYRGGEALGRVALLLAIDRRGGEAAEVRVSNPELDVAVPANVTFPWLP